MSIEERAQVAYEAFRRSFAFGLMEQLIAFKVCREDLNISELPPKWEYLSEEFKSSWKAAINAVTETPQ